MPEQFTSLDSSSTASPLPEPSMISSMISSFRSQAATLFVAFIIGLLTLFSSKITESVKYALNSADLHSKYYEELSMDLSEFVFQAELTTEVVENGWTTTEILVPLIKDYGDSITKLRKKEYVYLSWIQRFWKEDKLADLLRAFEAVKKFDKEIHALNDEFELVNILKTHKKVDPIRGKQVAVRLGPALSNLQRQSKELLIGLGE